MAITHLLPRHRSLDLLAQEMRQSLLEAGLTDLEAGSASRAFGEAMIAQISRFYDDLEETVRNSHPVSASGLWLDLIGADSSLPRLGSERVETVGNQRFFVPRGVLGDFTDGQDLTMGPGVEVRPPGDRRGPVYEVIPFVDGSSQFPVWRASQQEIFVRTVSFDRGVAANTPAHTLTSHNLPHIEIRTTNINDISHGREPESDNSYRFRLLGYGLTFQGSNRSAIERAALQEVDVDEVIVQPFTQGPGSITVVVVPRRGSGDPFLADRVRVRVQEVIGVGEKLFVRLARPIRLALSVRIRSVGEPSTVAEEVRAQILDYLGDLDAGDRLVISQLEAQIHNNVSLTQSVQVTTINIDGDSMSARDWQPDTDQIFIVEQPASRSIRIDVVS